MTPAQLNQTLNDATVAYEQAVESLRTSAATIMAARGLLGHPLAMAADLLAMKVPLTSRQFAAARERDPYRVDGALTYAADIEPLVQAEVERLK